MKTLIKGGTIVLEHRVMTGDLFIEDEKITRVIDYADQPAEDTACTDKNLRTGSLMRQEGVFREVLMPTHISISMWQLSPAMILQQGRRLQLLAESDDYRPYGLWTKGL